VLNSLGWSKLEGRGLFCKLNRYFQSSCVAIRVFFLKKRPIFFRILLHMVSYGDILLHRKGVWGNAVDVD